MHVVWIHHESDCVGVNSEEEFDAWKDARVGLVDAVHVVRTYGLANAMAKREAKIRGYEYIELKPNQDE